MRTAITAKFIGPSNVRGSRIKVESAARTIYVSWNHSLDAPANYGAAAKKLATELGWRGKWAGGVVETRGRDGRISSLYVFVNVTHDHAYDCFVIDDDIHPSHTLATTRV